MAVDTPAPTRCANCDARLDGAYCSQCGQEAVDLHRPFRKLLSEVIDDALSLDTRLLRTLRPLLFRPGVVIRAATLKGAEALGMADKVGSVEPGKLADMVVVGENPVQNLKVLYGTGAVKLSDTNDVVRVGGIRYTIKDGIVYDARKLLDDVRRIVREAKDKEGYEIRPVGR